MILRALALAAALAPAGALAQGVPVPAPLDGIARANWSGWDVRWHCTAFAVAPSVAVTAGHCLTPLSLPRLTLLFGYDRADYAERLVPGRAVTLGPDTAALCLPGEAPEALPVAEAPPRVGDLLRVTGYGRPRKEVQTEVACTVLQVEDEALILDCPLTHGASGAPVLTLDGEVVAVASGTTETWSRAMRLSPAALQACDTAQ